MPRSAVKWEIFLISSEVNISSMCSRCNSVTLQASSTVFRCVAYRVAPRYTGLYLKQFHADKDGTETEIRLGQHTRTEVKRAMNANNANDVEPAGGELTSIATRTLILFDSERVVFVSNN